MNRSPLTLKWVALCALVAVVASLVVTIASPAIADAQDSASATLALHVSEPEANQPFRTAALALDPGASRIAALGATLTFDTSDMTVSSCAVSEAGACNVRDGEVLISVFNLASLRANEQLLTINFEPTADAAATTIFTVAVTTAVNNQGEKVDVATAGAVQVELSAATVGSLTGTVVAAETATALFDIEVCAINDGTGLATCTTSTGLGNWRIDDLETGTYGVVASDETSVYDTSVASGFVRDDEVSLVAEIAMAYFTPPLEDEAGDADDQAPAVEDVTSDVVPPAVATPDEPLVILYEASIAGRITGLETESALVAAQVCATQPLVLHQSCATTDENGEFSLSGLSTGNYWVEVVDPLGQFEQTRPKLVGVIGDDVTRAGVNITMTAVAE